MRVIIDAFGGDNAPLEILRGAAMAVSELGIDILLTGREADIRRTAADNGISLDRMTIADAPDVIAMDDEPRSILKEHKDCSMAEGLRRLAAGEGDAMVSAGSTGALLMGSTFIVKRIKGVSRAALAAIMPGEKGPFMLLDSGANVDCRPDMLLQFAQMGSIYMTSVMSDKLDGTARVGLINVGTENTKGDELRHAAFALLKDSGLRFVGNIEARDIPANAADVYVADGFTGNVVLKLTEGVADMLMSELKGIFLAGFKTKLAALLVKSGIRGLKRKMSTAEYGGAPLLGIAKPVIKAHGNASAEAIKNAARVAARFAEKDVVGQVAAMVGAAEETDA